MPRLFLTKVWGFTPDVYPALGFNTEAARDKLVGESQVGDLVVMVGTKGADTAPEERGRLLGLVRLGTTPIDVEAVLHSVGTPIPRDHYNDAGRYRWPYGLPLLDAWTFEGPPDLAELAGDYLPGMEWAAYALDLAERRGQDLVDRILALPRTRVPIVDAPEIRRQRALQDNLALQSGPTGPGPSEARRAVRRTPGQGFVYLIELRGARRKAYKVGTTGDLDRRLSELDAGLIPAVTGCRWHALSHQVFATEAQAYAFEQAVHARLRRHRVDGETEVYGCSRGEVETEWMNVLADGAWAVRGAGEG